MLLIETIYTFALRVTYTLATHVEHLYIVIKNTRTNILWWFFLEGMFILLYVNIYGRCEDCRTFFNVSIVCTLTRMRQCMKLFSAMTKCNFARFSIAHFPQQIAHIAFCALCASFDANESFFFVYLLQKASDARITRLYQRVVLAFMWINKSPPANNVGSFSVTKQICIVRLKTLINNWSKKNG